MNSEAISIYVRLDATKWFHRTCIKGLTHYMKSENRPWRFCNDFANQFWLEALPAIIRKKPDFVVGVFSRPELKLLRAARIPYLSLLNCVALPSDITIASNDREIGKMAADHFIDNHISYCLYYGNVKQQPQSYIRGQGFIERCQEKRWPKPQCVDIDLDMNLLSSNSGQHMAKMAKAIMQNLESATKPIGLFCFSDDLAVQIYSICKNNAINIPDDVAIVGVDNDDILCDMLHPSLSSVNQNGFAIGYTAGKYLAHYISSDRWPAQSTLVPPIELVVRGSSNKIAIQDPLVLRALISIRTNVEEPMTVTTLANALGVSRRHLHQQFIKVLKRTPHEEIIRARLECAKKLLMTTDRTNLAIALDCGFGGEHRFEANFKKYEGMSPFAYRKGIRAGIIRAK